MTLRFQPARLMTPVIFILCLVALSYWLDPEPWRHMSLLTETTFAGALLILVGMAVAARSRSYLRMDERGLEIKYLAGKPRVYAWMDIEGARIFKKRLFLVPVMSTIRLKLRATVRPANAMQRAAGSVMGYDASFLAAYDESAEEILEKIEMFRRNHGANA
jgi:hypothetical protein